MTSENNMITVARYIETHCDEPLSLERLAGVAGLSPSRLQKNFVATFGVSPKAFQSSHRRDVFKDALKSGSSVIRATFEAGYGSTSRVVGRQGANIGMTPLEFKAGGDGLNIMWAVRETAFGTLMMAATDRGVCFVQFGANEQALLAQLATEFPKAAINTAHQSEQLHDWFDHLEAYLEARQPRPLLPLDLRGTAFQMLVWRFLLSIPDGETVNYSQVARGIGREKSVRAVANACGANDVAMLVPCHRVMRADGSLGGYRWGEAVKERLLKVERQIEHQVEHQTSAI